VKKAMPAEFLANMKKVKAGAKPKAGAKLTMPKAKKKSK
jgi:hypothetical protein